MVKKITLDNLPFEIFRYEIHKYISCDYNLIVFLYQHYKAYHMQIYHMAKLITVFRWQQLHGLNAHHIYILMNSSNIYLRNTFFRTEVYQILLYCFKIHDFKNIRLILRTRPLSLSLYQYVKTYISLVKLEISIISSGKSMLKYIKLMDGQCCKHFNLFTCKAVTIKCIRLYFQYLTYTEHILMMDLYASKKHYNFNKIYVYKLCDLHPQEYDYAHEQIMDLMNEYIKKILISDAKIDAIDEHGNNIINHETIHELLKSYIYDDFINLSKITLTTDYFYDYRMYKIPYYMVLNKIYIYIKCGFELDECDILPCIYDIKIFNMRI